MYLYAPALLCPSIDKPESITSNFLNRAPGTQSVSHLGGLWTHQAPVITGKYLVHKVYLASHLTIACQHIPFCFLSWWWPHMLQSVYQVDCLFRGDCFIWLELTEEQYWQTQTAQCIMWGKRRNSVPFLPLVGRSSQSVGHTPFGKSLSPNIFTL